MYKKFLLRMSNYRW